MLNEIQYKEKKRKKVGVKNLMSRCIGITKTGKKCRAPIQEGRDSKYFCCKSHEPFNMDFMEMGCFVCSESEFKPNEIVFLKCKHVLHKSCYTEWFMDHSTYKEKVCMICREEVYKKSEEKDDEREYIKTTKGVKKKKMGVDNYRNILDKIYAIKNEKKEIHLEFPLK